MLFRSVTDTNKDLIDDFNKKTSYIQKEFFSFTNKAKERKAISDRVAKEKREQDARIMKAEEERRARAKAEAERAAQYGAINYGRGSDGQHSYDSGQGFGTNATTGGPVSNRTGRGRTDYRYGGRASYFNGGIVSLRRR